MAEAAAGRGFSLCSLQLGGGEGVQWCFFSLVEVGRGDQLSRESPGTSATGHVLAGREDLLHKPF